MGYFELIHEVAEKKIQEWIEEGVFDNLEGKGRPLEMEDLSMVPPDLRMAYKILKNSGDLPPELLDAQDILTAVDLLAGCADEQERYRQLQKVNFLVMKANMRRSRPVYLEHDQVYYEKVVARTTVAPCRQPKAALARPRDVAPLPREEPQAAAGSRLTRPLRSIVLRIRRRYSAL